MRTSLCCWPHGMVDAENGSAVPIAIKRARVSQLLKPLTIGGAAAFLVASFLLLGGEVLEGDTHALDEQVAVAAKALRAAYPWLALAMRDLSALGSTAVLALFVAVAAGYLSLSSRRFKPS